MDVLDFINNQGEKTIPNPKYNKKSKKNSVLPTITVPDLDPNNDDAVKLAVADFENQYSIGAKEADKYRDYGINWNPWENLDKQLAEEQGALSKFGNALGRTVLSEILIGTALGTSDLVDTIFRSNYERNGVGQWLKEMQQATEDALPIYRDPDKNILNGGLLDAGWWAENIPSIASTITLMVPAMGVTKGIGLLNKLPGLAKKGATITGGIQKYANKALRSINKLERVGLEGERELTALGQLVNSPKYTNLIKTGTEITANASLQRLMENYQEAVQVKEDVYNSALSELNQMTDDDFSKFIEANPNYQNKSKDDIAKEIAVNSADKTFQLDMLNIGFDVLQVAALRNMWKGFKSSKVGASAVEREQADIIRRRVSGLDTPAAKATQYGKFGATGEFIGSKLKAGKAVMAAELSEGVEEMVNYVAQEEGYHVGNLALGKDTESRWDTRLSSYLQDGALWDSAFWGWMGGLVFQGVGSALGKVHSKLTNGMWQSGEIETRKKALKDREDKLNEFVQDAKNITENHYNIYANKLENDEFRTFENQAEEDAALGKLLEDTISDIAIDQMNFGNLDLFREYMSNEAVQESLIAQGVVDEAGAKEYFQHIQSIIDRTEQIYDNEIANASNIIGRLNAKGSIGKMNVTPQFLQMIASENTRLTNEINTLENKRKQVTSSIAKEEENLRSNGDMDDSIDYKTAIRLKTIAGRIAILEQNKDKILKEHNSIAKAVSLANIDKNIELLEKSLKSYDEYVWTKWLASTVTPDAEGRLRFAYNTPEAIAAYEEAKKFANIDDEIVKNAAILNMDKTRDEFISAVDTFGDNDKFNYLNALYEAEPMIDIYQTEAKSAMAKTEENVLRKLRFIEATFKEAKDNLPGTILNNIATLADKYGFDTAEEILYDIYENKNTDNLEELAAKYGINESEVETIKSTFNAINISENTSVLEGVQFALREIKKARDAAEAEPEVETVNPETAENPENSASPVTRTVKIGAKNARGGHAMELVDEGNTDTFGYQAIETDDGYELVIDSSDKDFDKEVMMSTLFTRPSNFDYTKPFEVVSNPVITFSSKKRYKVIKKGEVRNIPSTGDGEVDTTAAQTPVSTPAPAPVAEPAPAVEPEPKPAPAAKSTPSAPAKAEDLTSLVDNTLSYFAQGFTSRLSSNTINKDNFETEFNNIVEEVKQKLTNEGLTTDQVEARIARSAPMAKQAYGTKVGIEGKTRESRVAEVCINSNGYINPATQEVFDNYINAYKELIEQFVKDNATIEIDGKIYISPNNLLKYVNDVAKDNNIAATIYDSLMYYFETNEAKDKYTLIDANETKEVAREEINKSNDEIRAELTDTDVRVDIVSMRQMHLISEEEFNRLFDAFSIGQQLDYQITTDRSGGKHITLKVGNSIFAQMSVPKVSTNGTNITYSMINYGWKYEITSDVNNNPTSPLLDVFTKILIATDKNSDEYKVKELLYKYTYEKLTNDEKANLITEYANSPLIQSLKSRGLIDFKDDSYSFNHTIEHLSRIIRYVEKFKGYTTNADSEITEVIVNNILTNWFKVLQSNYSAITDFMNNQSGYTINVSDINEGILLRAKDEPQPVGPSTIANLNSNINSPNAQRIAAVDIRERGKMHVAGLSNPEDVSGFTGGSTFLVIPTRNGHNGYVQAYPRNIAESASFKPVIDAIKEELFTLIDKRYGTDANPGNHTDLINFINTIFNNKNGNRSLFNGVVIAKGKANSGGQITISVLGGKAIHLFASNQNSNTMSMAILDKKGKHTKENAARILKQFVEQELIPALTLNLSFDYIKADAKSDELIQGIATRKNNKFIISFDKQDGTTFTKEYDSFNEFVISNQLINVNTRIEDGKNYGKRSERNVVNQKLAINFVPITSSPVERNAQQQVAPSSAPNVVTEEDKIRNILNNKRIKNKGVAIAQLGLTAKQLSIVKSLDLLPKNIIFVDETVAPELNDGTYPADTSDYSDVVRIGKTYFDVWNNPAQGGKNRAIRVLIHEQLHNKLRERANKDVVSSIENIYDEYKEWVLANTEKDDFLRNFLYEDIDGKDDLEKRKNALEEFLVDSLTHKGLINALNSIVAKEYKTKEKKKTLFREIIEKLAKVFGWNIEKGKLYEKELMVLSDAFVEDVVQEEKKEEEKPTGRRRRADAPTADTTTTVVVDSDRRARRTRRSTVKEFNTETGIPVSEAPDLNSYLNRMHIAERAVFSDLVESAEVETQCR